MSYNNISVHQLAEEIRETLHYYAEVENFQPREEDNYSTPVLLDRGARARRVLTHLSGVSLLLIDRAVDPNDSLALASTLQKELP